MLNPPITGGCFCGRIRYEVNQAPIAMGFCHCRSCQKFSGCGHYAWVLMMKGAVKFTGEVKEFESSGGTGKTVYRGFCGHCGSRLLTRGERLGERMTLAAASLDDPSLFKPQMHLWTEDAQAWDCIDPKLHNFAQRSNL
jgi:hypothetical protein